ncbi:MAG: 5'-methylthioadenosine/S-adenosylhomocysteine nucleosidase, partial [Ruminococcus sp.]|nr:5'-methylthioadenosine/S-adenosylhomocysteine nucleosidase [Candidatus Apopatosoma intestinale]
AERIVNFGVVGGLTAEMGKQKVCVIDRVVHYKYDCSEFLPLKIGQVDGHDSVYLPTDPDLSEKALAVRPDLKKATCCSGDKFVATAEEKSQIHLAFDGDVCDMESAGIVLTCEANGIPCLLLKAVSDGLADGAKGFFEELFDASFLCLKTLDEILTRLTN